MLLVFDQVSAPFHRHHHDFGIDAELGLAVSHALDQQAGAPAFESHDDDDHEGQLGHAATALRSQGSSELAGNSGAADALIGPAVFAVVFPAVDVDSPIPSWPERGPPRFASFKSLPPAGRAPPLHV